MSFMSLFDAKPRTQNDPCFDWKFGLILGGWPSKIEAYRWVPWKTTATVHISSLRVEPFPAYLEWLPASIYTHDGSMYMYGLFSSNLVIFVQGFMIGQYTNSHGLARGKKKHLGGGFNDFLCSPPIFWGFHSWSNLTKIFFVFRSWWGLSNHQPPTDQPPSRWSRHHAGAWRWTWYYRCLRGLGWRTR